MAGLIDTAMKDPLKTITGEVDTFQTASSTGVDPVTRTVAPEETVAGQATNLMKEDSPLMQQAVAGSTRAANRRGLINTSMAVSAGQDAALKSVLPIASQDAQTFTAAATDNMAAKNNALDFNASAANTTNAANTAALNQTARTAQQGTITERLAKIDADLKAGLIDVQEASSMRLQAQNIAGQKDLTVMSGEINKQLQTLKGDQATNLANIESNYKQLIQTSTAAAGAYGTAIPMLAAIMANTDTTPEQKQQAVDRVTGLLKANLATIGSIGNVDITSLVDFS